MDGLSNRLKECLQLSADGKTTSEIADELCLSEHTVNNHLIKVQRILNAANRAHAVAKAIRAGII